jgi:hypothetical protein
VGVYLAACRFKNVVDGYEWAFAGVYGPNGNSDRCWLWDELAGLLSCWVLSWCIRGILMLLGFLAKGWVGGASAQP